MTTSDVDPTAVRDTILDSWRRSRDLHVHMDRIELPFVGEPDLDTPLTVAASPVLASLADDMAEQPVSVILTSADGVVLERMTSEARINRALDSVQLARGYSYAEQFVGTNGIGTALETRKPALVLGQEHYVGDLTRLACAGVPIHHPVTGAVLGVLNMTCWADQATSLLLALTKNASRQIEQQLLAHSNEREIDLLNRYLTVAKRSTLGVLAIGGDVVLMNPRVRRALDATDQVALLEHAVDTTTSSARTVVAELPSGRSVKLTAVDRVDVRSGGTNVVFQVLLDDGVVHSRGSTRTRALTSTLPGVVGRSASFRRSCEQIERCHRDRHWVVVEGERGSGRSTVVTAVAQHLDPSARIRVMRCADFSTSEQFLSTLSEEMEDDDFSVVITDLDSLPPELLDPVALMLQSSEGSGWVAATVDSNVHDADVETTLLPFFSHTVTMPALRHRSEDIDDLIPHLLETVGKGADARLSPAVLRQLGVYSWPGNIAQLKGVLSEMLSRQRTGVIGLELLPAECRSTNRRRLSQLEALERDAIVKSLAENRGSKIDAAAALGLSRATIYRKIKDYGLT